VDLVHLLEAEETHGLLVLLTRQRVLALTHTFLTNRRLAPRAHLGLVWTMKKKMMMIVS
jgi:hypothetical protein